MNWKYKEERDLPQHRARERIPPVLVPDIQSKYLITGPPRIISIASSIWIRISPRIPPPSKHKMRPPTVDFLETKSIYQNTHNGKIICAKTYDPWLAVAECWQTWWSMASKRWRVRGICSAEDDCPSSFPVGLHPSPHFGIFWEQRFAPTAWTQYNNCGAVLERFPATKWRGDSPWSFCMFTLEPNAIKACQKHACFFYKSKIFSRKRVEHLYLNNQQTRRAACYMKRWIARRIH